MKAAWPKLSFSEAKETYETIHLWTQIAGKIKLSKMPWINHSWHVTMAVTPTGLSTLDIPAEDKHFQLDFDFVQHQLQIKTSSGQYKSFALENMSVANCYKKVLATLSEFDIPVEINLIPNELEDPTPLDEDHTHASYDPEHAVALHKALLYSQQVFTQFKAAFRGKCSPVHFFWGSFDLAVSRFSGREAPKHPGGIPNLPDWVAQEAYSHEVYSCGFWPGNEALPFAAFYSYIYPEPDGFKDATIQPEQAYYHEQLREFVLPYDAVQQASNPPETLSAFLQSTYNAAADLAKWDRSALEVSVPVRK